MKRNPALIIIIALSLLAILAISQCSKYKSRTADYSLILDLTEKKFEAFKTEAGNNAAKSGAKILDLQTLLILEKEKVDKLVKQLRLKPKSITRIIETQLEGKDSIILQRDTILYPESSERPSPYVFQDKWNYFEAYDMGGEIGLSYSITDSLYIVETKDGNRRNFTAYTSNPAVRITGMSAIVIDEPAKKKKKWWIVPAAIAVGAVVGAKAF